jgi:hypothetical protein
MLYEVRSAAFIYLRVPPGTSSQVVEKAEQVYAFQKNSTVSVRPATFKFLISW